MSTKFYIFGSCVSRDGFELQDKNGNYDFLDPIKYYARYSISRLNFPSFEDGNKISEKLLSSFQRKIVQFEFSNSLISDLEATDFDYFIIDLIDERFGLLELESGKFVTFSDELKRTGIDTTQLRKINVFDDEFYDLWKSGVDILFNKLKELGKLDRVIINDVLWSYKLENGQLLTEHPEKKGLKLSDIEQYNQLLLKQYAYLDTFKIEGVRNIGYASNIFVSSLNHKWGISSFHYVDSVYAYFIERLKEIIKEDSAKKDYQRWIQPTIKCVDIEDAVENIKKYKNGIYIVQLPNTKMTIDILVRNFSYETVSKEKKILCSLNGAIFNRQNKKLPFFTLTELSKEVGRNVPFISISDPSLQLSKELNLAWYNGNSEVPDLLLIMSRFFDKLIMAFDSNQPIKVILVGGSGGGYAILKILSKLQLPNHVKAIIWNPQFSIIEYNLDAVRRYIYYCFEFLKQKIDRNKYELKELMLNNHIEVEVAGKVKSETVLLFNNKDQKHIFSHFKEYFVSNYNDEDIICRNGIFNFGGVKLLFNDWGEGHAAPAREDIKDIVIAYMESTENVDQILFKKTAGKLPVLTNEYLNKDSYQYFQSLLKTRIDNNKLHISFPIDKVFSVYNLVYYLVCDGKTLNSLWDTRRTEIEFTLTSNSYEKLSVRIYIRSPFGEQLIISRNLINS